jgi:polyisoprenoid-binding protein YceI
MTATTATQTPSTSTSSASAKTTVWELDPAHSSANFSVKHMMIAKVHGSFHKLSAVLRLDRANPANSSVEATIDASTVNTNEPKRDDHLRSPDFFDVAKYPTLSFKSKRFEAAGGDNYRVIGDLTLHGVTKEVALDVEAGADEMKDPYGNIKIGASATTKINRKEFGLGWNAALETGGVLVGEIVTISLDLQFAKKG